jgi:hypothetical protein
MTLGRTSSNAIKIKTDSEGGGLRAVKCACCGCESDAIFQSLTASLPHHGFAPFSCDGGSNSNTSTRYLTNTVSGLATTGCGEYKKHGQASRSYTIDPMTGYVCIGGEPAPYFWCSPGSREADQCSPTSRKWDCGIISNSQKALNCGKGQDEDGNPLRLTLEENLSDAYTLDDVESNVDALLSQNPIDDNSMPPGVAGTVVTGSGHSIITWGGTAATSAYFYKGNGQVMKTKLRVTFPTATSYKLVTKDESGGVLSEITREATAGQVITVPPPSSPGYTTVEPSCAFPSIPTTLDCNVSGGTTTSRLVCRDDSTEEIPCPSCNYFIGPDCEQYNTKTVTSSATGSYESSYFFGFGDGDDVNSELNASGNTNSVTTTTINGDCSQTNSCEGTKEVIDVFTYSEAIGGFAASDITTTTDNIDLCTGEGTCTQSVVYPDFPEENRSNSISCGYAYDPSTATGCTASCDGSTTEKGKDYDSFLVRHCYTGEDSEGGGYLDITVIRTSSISLSANTVTMKGTFNLTSDMKECVYETYEETHTAECNTEVVYSNPEEGGAAGNWETESLPWCSGEQTEGCVSFSGCVGNYSGPTYRTKSNASISCQATFSAPESEDAKYFETWFHYYTVEDSGPGGIESNLGATGCRVRTVRAFNTRVGTSSGGGQVSVSGPSISLSTSEGKTKCLMGPIVYTYEIQ